MRLYTDILENTDEKMKRHMLRSSLAQCRNSQKQGNLPSCVSDWRVSAIRKPFFHYIAYKSLLHLEYRPEWPFVTWRIDSI